MESAAELRQRAQRYRRMASELTDPRTVEALEELAAQYEAAADLIAERYGGDRHSEER